MRKKSNLSNSDQQKNFIISTENNKKSNLSNSDQQKNFIISIENNKKSNSTSSDPQNNVIISMEKGKNLYPIHPAWKTLKNVPTKSLKINSPSIRVTPPNVEAHIEDELKNELEATPNRNYIQTESTLYSQPNIQRNGIYPVSLTRGIILAAILAASLGSAVFPFLNNNLNNYLKNKRNKQKKTKKIKLDIFYYFEVGTPIAMCQTDEGIQQGQVGHVIKVLSSITALVEFTLGQDFIDPYLIKATNGSYGQGLVVVD